MHRNILVLLLLAVTTVLSAAPGDHTAAPPPLKADEAKLKEISNRVQKTTIEVVGRDVRRPIMVTGRGSITSTHTSDLWPWTGKDGRDYALVDRSRPNDARTDDVVTGLEAGADDYLTKPYDPEELRSRVRAGERILALEEALASKVVELEASLAHVKQLQGLLPICMHCKSIRDDKDTWHHLEAYIEDDLTPHEIAAREGLQRNNLRLVWSEDLVERLIKSGFDQRYGARPLQRTIETMVVAPLAKQRLIGAVPPQLSPERQPDGAHVVRIRADASGGTLERRQHLRQVGGHQLADVRDDLGSRAGDPADGRDQCRDGTNVIFRSPSTVDSHQLSAITRANSRFVKCRPRPSGTIAVASR